jgi:1,4-dihydroxy-2-naphthoate octaprenyltransferase
VTGSTWLAAVRPRTLTASIGAVCVGAALAHDAGKLREDIVVAALAVAVCLQIAANLYNDYGDWLRGADVDRIGPARVVQSGLLSPSAVRMGAVVAMAIAALAGCYLVARIGWPALAIGAVAMISAIAYTAGPAPLAYVGLGDAFVLLFFGVVAVCGTYFAQAQALSLRVVVMSVAVGLVATAILVVNNLRDRHGDAKAGKRTLVVRFGASFGRGEYGAALLVAYLLPLALAIAERRPALLLPLLSAPLAWRQYRRVVARDGADLNVDLARTAQLGLVFDGLLAIGVIS